MELWPSERWRVSPTGRHFHLPVTVAMSCDAREIPSNALLLLEELRTALVSEEPRA